MSISNTLATALSGLGASGRLAEVASNNLANALTKGYGRQSVELGSSVSGGTPTGVAVRAVTRAASPDLTAARRQADSDAASGEAEARALARLGAALGEATDEESLFNRVGTFERALRQFAETPENEPRQIQTVDAARDLTGFLNKLSTETATVRQNADTTIADQVATVNRNLDGVVKLNRQITRLSSGGRDVATLVDQRERLIDEISAMIPVRTYPREHGKIHITTAQGLFLVSETATKLEFSNSPIITSAMSYDPAGGGALSGLTLDGVDITPTSGHPQAIESGALAGHFAVRDQFAPEMVRQIDQFAADMIARFEDVTVDPTLSPGDAGLFTDAGATLDPTTIEGLAGRIAVNGLVDRAQGGDPARLRDGLQSIAPGPATSDTIARNLLDALTTPRPAGAIPGLAGNLGASQMVAGIVELTGVRRVDAEDDAAALNGTREALATREGAEIGVNSDAELQNLIQIEQAFAANVQVMQTASRMLQEVLEIR